MDGKKKNNDEPDRPESVGILSSQHDQNASKNISSDKSQNSENNDKNKSVSLATGTEEQHIHVETDLGLTPSSNQSNQPNLPQHNQTFKVGNIDQSRALTTNQSHFEDQLLYANKDTEESLKAPDDVDIVSGKASRQYL